jgi:hypothetical protein
VPSWTNLGFKGSLHSDLWELARLAYPEGRKRALDSSPHVFPFRDHPDEKKEPDEQFLCFDYLYYTAVREPREWEYDYSPVWRFVGKHLRFREDLIKIADGYIRRSMGISEGDATPPVRLYIASLTNNS